MKNYYVFESYNGIYAVVVKITDYSVILHIIDSICSCEYARLNYVTEENIYNNTQELIFFKNIRSYIVKNYNSSSDMRAALEESCVPMSSFKSNVRYGIEESEFYKYD